MLRLSSRRACSAPTRHRPAQPHRSQVNPTSGRAADTAEVRATLTAPRSASCPWWGRSCAPISPTNGFTYRTALRTELGPARLPERTTRLVGCPVVR